MPGMVRFVGVASVESSSVYSYVSNALMSSFGSHNALLNKLMVSSPLVW